MKYAFHLPEKWKPFSTSIPTGNDVIKNMLESILKRRHKNIMVLLVAPIMKFSILDSADFSKYGCLVMENYTSNQCSPPKICYLMRLAFFFLCGFWKVNLKTNDPDYSTIEFAIKFRFSRIFGTPYIRTCSNFKAIYINNQQHRYCVP